MKRPTARVFAIQQPHRLSDDRSALVPKFDLRPAEEYGEIVYLLSPTASPFNLPPLVAEIHEKLRSMTPDDSILLIGNPVLIGVTVAVAAQYCAQPRLLQWSGRERRYLPIRSPVILCFGQCADCGNTLTVETAAKKHDAKNGYRNVCKPCHAGRMHRWHESHPGRRIDYNLKANYGIGLEEYEKMLADQGGACSICGKPETALTRAGGKPRRLAVDHDHETGQVRALLCGNCNKAIGCAKEDPERLRAAADYLESWTKK